MTKVLFLTLLITVGLSAQTSDDILFELNQTDRVIERVTPLVEQSENSEAKSMLAEARRIQAQAWEAYHARRYRFALGQTRYARKKARDAAALVEISPERVREELRLTAELMERVRMMVARVEDARTTELWNMAQTEQATARQSYEIREYRRALKFTYAARMHAREIADLLGRYVDPDRFEAILAKTSRLLERVRLALAETGNQRSLELLRKALELQTRARNTYGSRELRIALKLTMAAREMAFRALEIGLGSASREVVEQALAATSEMLDDWAGQLADETADTEAARLLDQARSLQQTAREQLAAGQNSAALNSTNRARRLLQRAIELIQSGERAPGQR